MGLQPVPDDQNSRTDGGRESLEELHDLRALDRAGEQAEVKAPEADSGNRRNQLPAKAISQNRCLASGSPSARDRGVRTGPIRL